MKPTPRNSKSLVRCSIFKALIRCSIFILLLVWGCSSPEQNQPAPEPREKLFVSLPAQRTGVDFANMLMEHPSPNRNLLLYEYFSNGAGVAVGDINGDGFEDLYFAGNMSYNRMYLGDGDLSFSDVTDIAGVGGRKNTWKTGVAMVDVNGDGRLDLYLCYSGDLPLDRRVDELYINLGNNEQGVPQFEERAGAYGLANPHSSNQAYFLDYDRDNDLDLLLLTHNVKNLPLPNENNLQSFYAEDPVNGVRFYRNDGDRFTDVTVQTGILSSAWSYGLGAGLSDFNGDGWMDMYVGNDYATPDFLYINNQDGTFSDQLGAWVGHTSNASMGIDVADINNDGHTDVMVLDMLPEDSRRQKTMFIPSSQEGFQSFVRMGFHRQYMRNTLQLNNGNSTFSEIGWLAGVAATNWSWTPLFADFDNDGYKDLYVTNGYLHDTVDRDFLMFKRNYVASRGEQLAPEDIGYLMGMVPPVDMQNHVFRNTDGLQFEDVSADWGLAEPLKSTGAVYADLDNDGDLDLVVSNINAPVSIYENRAAGQNYVQVQLNGEAGNTTGLGARVTLFAGGQQQVQEQMPTRGYLSSVSYILHFGLGVTPQIDSLHIAWPDGRRQVMQNVSVNQRVVADQRNSMSLDGPFSNMSAGPIFEEVASPVDFVHEMERVDDFSRQPLLDFAQSYAGPALAVADVDGDGLEDVFAGGAAGQPSRLYRQRGQGRFEAASQQMFRAEAGSQDVAALFFDANGDGAVDLYVASGGYGTFGPADAALQDRLYLNDGTGSFTRMMEALPEMLTSTGAVAAQDINEDGAMDLFVGGRVVPGRYPETPRSYVLINNGQGRFEEQTESIAPMLASAGMITDAVWHDLDGNGRAELVIAGHWMPIRVFENNAGVLTEVTSSWFDAAYTGFWNTLLLDDLNGDGRVDLLAGNLGQNSALQASAASPLWLYADDFNNDGLIDPLLVHQENGRQIPRATLDELYVQLPAIAGRFQTYQEYAGASINNLISEARLAEAQQLQVAYVETSLFLQQADGVFTQQALPLQAQFAPVHVAAVVEREGRKDVVLAGNSGEEYVRMGRQDANYGILLENNGAGDFEYVPQDKTGLVLNGPIRSMVKINDLYMFGVNNYRLKSYRLP